MNPCRERFPARQVLSSMGGGMERRVAAGRWRREGRDLEGFRLESAPGDERGGTSRRETGATYRCGVNIFAWRRRPETNDSDAVPDPGFTPMAPAVSTV